ncbi:hypothetical protein PN838_11750 [Psychrosphaera sp. G1-22]|uniref:RHS repeat-associated core domain-containing protein n=1 Tax=Psychrosphaera algicola TaxID=3023714 RepID=A0ABT5FCS6_9GAMM|nr:RHS repeat-associated core domain-containing protein [Psychrosphaera sp. G1-22]MDC2889332.1 hypothetical protein [Psychrosphaera sp. G1-22]
MNGRVYDYNLGRFMSVDPFIQSPTSTQSVNPYSYIMNNPLSGTDPTGYACTMAGKANGDCGSDITGVVTNVESSSDNGATTVKVSMKVLSGQKTTIKVAHQLK